MRMAALATILFLSGISLWAKEPRVVTICALSDAAKATPQGIPIATVQKKEIEKIVSNTSREYQRNVNIVFTIVEYHETAIPMFPAGAFPEKFRAMCNEGDLVAIFTNQEGLRIDSDGEFLLYAGFNQISKGVIWSYEVGFPRVSSGHKFREHAISLLKYHRWSVGEAGVNPVTTLKHEIGHSFGLDDSFKNDDFMYAGLGSHRWSNRIRMTIRKNRNRTWNSKTISSAP
jgi:hypothetical protein